ncbi:hypothetical protein [Bacteroides acidifaciens]|uniref:hypothetical protein n=1 Tax=Bacteroides acidifaciens TaxID=85831 RepID=UPI0025581EB2|nr:hypothetical protein [Bacteroides acidifaciens]
MNRMKVFLLLAVVIGFSACQSRSKQAAEQEMTDDSLYVSSIEEEKTIIGVVGDASTIAKSKKSRPKNKMCH